MKNLTRIILELETIQRMEYAAGGYGYIVLSDAIELLKVIEPIDECGK